MRFKHFHLSAEQSLLLVAGILQVASALWVYHLGLTRSLYDAQANLLNARFITQSFLPGFTQASLSWHPLMSFLLFVPCISAFLFRSGLAAAVVIFPIFLLGVRYLYRTVSLLTDGNVPVSVVSSLAYILNPYVLYYATVAMSEVVFVSFVFGVTYYLARWLTQKNITDLVACGAFVSLCVVTRLEGYFVIPGVSLIVLLELIRRRSKWEEVEAAFIIFWFWALVGSLFYVATGWLFKSDPLNFLHPALTFNPATKKPLAIDLGDQLPSLSDVFMHFLFGAFYSMGEPLVIASFVCFFLYLIKGGGRFWRISTLLILGQAFFYITALMLIGKVSVGVPELPMMGKHHEVGRIKAVRYLLQFVGFTSIMPGLVLSMGYDYIRRLSRWLAIAFLSVGLSLIVGCSLYFAVNILFVDQFTVVIRHEGLYLPPDADFTKFVKVMDQHYDYGLILAVRVNDEPFLSATRIPLSRFIHESVFRYYQQTIAEPWWFVRWVILAPNQSGQIRASIEQPLFADYFDQVFNVGGYRLFRLRVAAVRAAAVQHGFEPARVPSLQFVPETWNPATIMHDMLKTSSPS